MEPSPLRKLVRSWLFQDVGWFALSECAARILLELVFVLLLAALGVGLLRTIALWLLFHTTLWFLLYGGYMRLWVVRERATPVARLQSCVERTTARIQANRAFQHAVLRGSAARGELTPHSDIDFLVVPGPGTRGRTRAVLAVWRLRLGSVLGRIPLQVRCVDTERYLPFLLINTVPVIVRSPSGDRDIRPTEGGRGLLVTFSGMDGSGKTTAARQLVSEFADSDYRTSYFYGHRQAWYVPRSGRPQLSLSIVVESLWKRLGKSLDDFAGFRSAKFAYDAATCLDYVYVRWKLAQLLESNAIVVSDRSAADVIAYLRSFGPVYGSLEGLLAGIAPKPDLGFLFRIAPEDALARKREHGIERLRKFAAAYADLETLLGLVPIDASQPAAAVHREVMDVMDRRLGLSPRGRGGAQPEIEKESA